MGEVRGRLTFTVHSVTFPNVPFGGERVAEEISVHADAEGGGVFHEFNIRWYELGGLPVPRVEVFDDGLALLLDDRVRAVIERMKRGEEGSFVPVSPGQVADFLVDVGAVPSRYYLAALARDASGVAEKAVLEERLAEARRFEGEE